MERLGGLAEKVRARADADFFGLDHLSDLELGHLLEKSDTKELRSLLLYQRTYLIAAERSFQHCKELKNLSSTVGFLDSDMTGAVQGTLALVSRLALSHGLQDIQHHSTGLANLGHTLLDALAGAVTAGFLAGLNLLDVLPSLLLCLSSLDRQGYQDFREHAVDFLLGSIDWRHGIAQLMATLLDVEVSGAEEDRLMQLCGQVLADLPPSDLCATLRQVLAWSEHSAQNRWTQLAYLLLAQGEADQDSLGFVLELALRHSTRLGERLLGIVSDGHQLTSTDVQVLLCMETIEPLRGTSIEFLTALALSHPSVFLQLTLSTVERQGERRASLLVDLAVSVLERSLRTTEVAHHLLLQIYERLCQSRTQLLSLVLRKIAEFHIDQRRVEPFLLLLRHLVERFPADIQPQAQTLIAFLSHLLDISLDCAKAYLDAVSPLLPTSRGLVDALFVSTRKWLQQWSEDRKALGCHALALLLVNGPSGNFDWDLVKPILGYPLFARSVFLERLNRSVAEVEPSRASKLLDLLLPRLTRFFVSNPSPTLSLGKLFDENGNPRENLGLVLSLLFQLMDICQDSVGRELTRSVIGVFAKALFPRDLANVTIPEKQFDTIVTEALPITTDNRISVQVRNRLLCQAFLVFAERISQVSSLFGLTPAALIDNFKSLSSLKLEATSVTTLCYLLSLCLSPLNDVTATHLLASLELLLSRPNKPDGDLAAVLSLLLRLHDQSRPVPGAGELALGPGLSSEDQYHNLSAKLLHCVALVCRSFDGTVRGGHPELDQWLAKLPGLVKTEIDFGVMASTLSNYVSVASALLEAGERKEFAVMINEVLTSYRIPQAPIVRAFTEFLLSAEPVDSIFTLSQDILARVLTPDTDDGPCFAASPACADAALTAVLRYLAAHLAPQPELLTFFDAVVLKPGLSARMCVALCLAAGRAARHHSKQLASSRVVAPALLERLALFADRLLAWCDRTRCTRTPDLVFKLEKLELLIKRRLRVLDQGSLLRFLTSGDALRIASVLSQGERATVAGPKPELSRARPGKDRLRSRNAFIDAALKEQAGADDFADLEDFIVCKKGKSYA